MKKILLPTNFSQEVREAHISIIKELMRKKDDFAFTLIHSYEQPKFGQSLGHDISEVLEKATKEDLKKELNLLKEAIPSIQIDWYIGEGSLAYVVNQYDKESVVDFMIVPLVGSNMFKDILSDSSPSELARRSNVPMLFLPNSTTQVSLPSNIVFGIDVKPFENEDDFLGLLNIIEALDAKLQFLYVMEDKESKQEAFDKYYKPLLKKCSYEYIELAGEDASESIVEYINKNNCDGIALIERKGNFIQRLFKISLLENVIKLAKLPMLVINELREAI